MIPARAGNLIARIQQREADLAQLRAEAAALHRAQVADLAALGEALADVREDPASEKMIAEKVEALRAACIARGIAVTGDDHVREADAATLLGRSRRTLRNRRKADCPIPWLRRGVHPIYSLEALARYLVEHTEIGEDVDL